MSGACRREGIAFLRRALPRLGLAWPGFRRVHRQVCRRVRRRLQALGLPDFAAYQAYLEGHPAEWPVLDGLCRIPISRFYRDGEVFDVMGEDVLPALAGGALESGRQKLRCWSAGCASGEEPYSLAMLWHYRVARRYPGISLEIAASDIDRHLLARARQGCYRRSSLGELPSEWIAGAFARKDDLVTLEPEWRERVSYCCHDMREEPPFRALDLILCRNLAFTYFEPERQRAVLRHFLEALRPGGGLVVGRTETLPGGVAGIAPWLPRMGIYRKEVP